jgi:hypothetical protein
VFIQQLESVLPKPTPIEIPKGDNVEEVQLIDFHTTKSAHDDRHGNRRENYEAGDSDDEGAHPGVHTCRSQ